VHAASHQAPGHACRALQLLLKPSAANSTAGAADKVLLLLLLLLLLLTLLLLLGCWTAGACLLMPPA
jgi:hypothetical protein